MNRFALVRAGLRRGTLRQVGLFLGASLTTAVFVGALAVGDSVKATLEERALDRIGRVDAVLDAGDRFVTAALADALRDGGDGEVAAVLALDGVAMTPDGRHRANAVRVLGVDDDFPPLSRSGRARPGPMPGGVHLNERLARQLSLAPGDPVVLRVERPSALPRETTLGDAEDLVVALRVRFGGVVPAEDGGAFSLEASPIPPYVAFVDREWLAAQLEVPSRANLLLATGDAEGWTDRLTDAWTLDDLELSLESRDGLAVLRSRRVLIDPAVEEAARASGVPGLAGSTTFVQRIARVRDDASPDGGAGANALPYSTVTAIEVIGGSPPAAASDAAALVPADLAPDEIVLHDAAAARLAVSPGARLRIDAWTLGDDLHLDVASREFRLRAVVPLEGAAEDPHWMPDLPGLKDEESCRDWDPSVPIDLEALTPWDETYWAEHRGTPKAYVAPAAARELWGSRYGTWTELRVEDSDGAALEEHLLLSIPPAALGLAFEDVRTEALAAGHPATDFGGLFLGLSLFLIGAAVLLTSLVFRFGVEQRAAEIGALRAIGFTPGAIARLLLGESLLVALLGAVPGVALGVGYTSLVLRGLETLWSDAVAAASISFHAGAASLVGGPLGALLVAAAAMAFSLRRHVRAPVSALLRGRGALPVPVRPKRPSRRGVVLTAIAALAGAGLAVLAARRDGPSASGLAFLAGSAALVAGLFACRGVLSLLRTRSSLDLTVARVGTRAAGRRPGRSLATVALLASGVFLVVSVGVHRLDPGEAERVEGGTGGYALWAESTVRLRHDLDDLSAAVSFGLDEETLARFSSLPMRARDGDEASCLNLASATNPVLVGVPAATLAERGAFTFTAVQEDERESDDPAESPWRLLLQERADGAVPAIGDAASVQWALHRAVGDTLEFVDSRGEAFPVRIVATVGGSILQGMLLIDDAAFRERFPDAAGFRRFLIDVDGDVAPVAEELTRAYADVGLEVTPAAERLAAYQSVQNTYLAIFQALGALGVLLGTMGLALVVLRNLFERRGELATLRALGFSRTRLQTLLLFEHGLLLALGVAVGGLAALVAVLPAQGTALANSPWIVVAAVTIVGAGSVAGASAIATRGRLLDALRAE